MEFLTIAVGDAVDAISAALDLLSLDVTSALGLQMNGGTASDTFDIYESNRSAIATAAQAQTQAQKIVSVNGLFPSDIGGVRQRYLYVVRTAAATAGLSLLVVGRDSAGTSVTFPAVAAALASADSAVNFNGQELTSVGTPTAPTSVATRGYADVLATMISTSISTQAVLSASELFFAFRCKAALRINSVVITLIGGAWTANDVNYWQVRVLQNNVGVRTKTLQTAGAGGTGDIAQGATATLVPSTDSITCAAGDVITIDVGKFFAAPDLPISEISFDITPV